MKFNSRKEEVRHYHGERFRLQGCFGNLSRVAHIYGGLKELEVFEALIWEKVKSAHNIKTK